MWISVLPETLFVCLVYCLYLFLYRSEHLYLLLHPQLQYVVVVVFNLLSFRFNLTLCHVAPVWKLLVLQLVRG